MSKEEVRSRIKNYLIWASEDGSVSGSDVDEAVAIFYQD